MAGNNVETKTCKKCMEQINKKAKKCPKCGANLGMPGWVKFLIVIAIIFGLCISCVGGCLNSLGNAVDELDESINEAFAEYEDINGKTTFNIGETFENKHLKVTITGVNTNWTGYDQYMGPSDGKKVVKIDITAENVSGESEDISSLYFDCYADAAPVNEYIWSGDHDFGGTLTSGKKTSGSIYFEVPVNSQKLTLEYQPSVLDSSIVIEFNLN